MRLRRGLRPLRAQALVLARGQQEGRARRRRPGREPGRGVRAGSDLVLASPLGLRGTGGVSHGATCSGAVTGSSIRPLGDKTWGRRRPRLSEGERGLWPGPRPLRGSRARCTLSFLPGDLCLPFTSHSRVSRRSEVMSTTRATTVSWGHGCVPCDGRCWETVTRELPSLGTSTLGGSWSRRQMYFTAWCRRDKGQPRLWGRVGRASGRGCRGREA